MIEGKCKRCGKVMLFNNYAERRKFCCRKCFREQREEDYTKEDDAQVVLPPLESICDQGFIALVEAIVGQARDDVLTSAPGTMIREDAEAFFMSEVFYEMTNLDGFDILCRLQDKYDEKMRRKAERKAHAGRV